jgi:WD40 repeat protein
VVTSDGTTRIWDLVPQRSRERLLLVTRGQGRWDLAVSPDGRRLATIGPQGIGVWDVETDRALMSHAAVNRPLSGAGSVHLVVSPDGARLAAAGLDTAVVLDATTGRQLRTLPGRPPADLAVSPDGTRLATAGPNGTRLWDAASGQPVRTLPDADLRQAVGFSPDGRLLATAGGSDGRIRLWDPATGKQQSVLAYTTSSASSSVLHVTFGPDGRRLAATILDTGTPDLPVPASRADGTVMVWDVATGKRQLTLRGHAGVVYDAAFSPDGTRLATAGFDGTVRLWDSHTGAQLVTVTEFGSPVRGVAFSPDGRLLASLAEDGTVRLDVVAIGDLITLAQQRVTRGFTDDECRRYLHLDRCPDR